MTEPRLATAIGLWLLAIVMFCVGYAIKDRVSWLAWILMLCGVMFGFFAAVQSLDVTAYRTGQRMREINAARVLHVTQVANAVAGLTSGRQLELVEQFGVFQIGMIMSDRLDMEPILFLQSVGGGKIMYDDLTEFLRASVPTYPALLAIRNGKNWRKAAEITDTFIAAGVAEKVGGSSSARLTVPIEKLARHLYVELDISELEE